MENSYKLVIFIVVLLAFGTGNKIMAKQVSGIICVIPYLLPNCTDHLCKSECVRKFPPNGNGLCQGTSHCICNHPCS
ncbi:hypothetical protein GQ457_07G008840 [Hibiscus cannabinus]